MSHAYATTLADRAAASIGLMDWGRHAAYTGPDNYEVSFWFGDVLLALVVLPR